MPTRPKTGVPLLLRVTGSPTPAAVEPLRRRFADRRTIGRSIRRTRTGDAVHHVQSTRVVQGGSGESAVTRELRALYEKNGKQMPEMNLNRLPKTLRQARARIAKRDLRRKPGTATNSRFGFLNRFLPFGLGKSNQRPQTRQPFYHNLLRRRTPASQPRFTAQPARLRRVPQQPGQTRARIRISPISNPNTASPAKPATRTAESEFFPADQTRSERPSTNEIPLLIDDRRPQTKPVKQSVVAPQPQAKTPEKSDPLNPFPNLSESEADNAKAAPRTDARNTQATEQPPADKGTQANPFTGRKLTDGEGGDDDPFAGPAETPAARTPERKQPAAGREHPLAAKPEPKRVSTLQIKSAQQLRREQLGKPRTAAPAAKSRRPKLSREAKLWLIAERKGLPGFRGFCPVELRDHRDLVDSKSMFKSVFQGRTYFLSSREAKAQFERSPQKYAPAMGGRDVIRLIDGTESVDGSLAHAVWFRDRLYFFSSAQTLQKFTRNPQKYAVSP
ncbi:MAG: hypothetical protein ACE5KM_17725 [Planctomycetaceae bacterium]